MYFRRLYDDTNEMVARSHVDAQQHLAASEEALQAARAGAEVRAERWDAGAPYSSIFAHPIAPHGVPAPAFFRSGGRSYDSVPYDPPREAMSEFGLFERLGASSLRTPLPPHPISTLRERPQHPASVRSYRSAPARAAQQRRKETSPGRPPPVAVPSTPVTPVRSRRRVGANKGFDEDDDDGYQLAPPPDGPPPSSAALRDRLQRVQEFVDDAGATTGSPLRVRHNYSRSSNHGHDTSKPYARSRSPHFLTLEFMSGPPFLHVRTHARLEQERLQRVQAAVDVLDGDGQARPVRGGSSCGGGGGDVAALVGGALPSPELEEARQRAAAAAQLALRTARAAEDATSAFVAGGVSASSTAQMSGCSDSCSRARRAEDLGAAGVLWDEEPGGGGGGGGSSIRAVPDAQPHYRHHLMERRLRDLESALGEKAEGGRSGGRASGGCGMCCRYLVVGLLCFVAGYATAVALNDEDGALHGWLPGCARWPLPLPAAQ